MIIKIYVTDNFSYGPETSEYQFELKVVEPGQETYIDAPSEPPPEQEIPESAGLFSTADQLPVATIESMSSNGLLKIKLSKPIVGFPENFKSLVDRNAKGYVE